MLLPYLETGRVEAGCDEAGRGCLAGPVFAAAVILPDGFENELLNDSKKLSEHQRNMLRPVIESQALAWGVGIVTAAEIDQINILNASFLAMHRAIAQLSQYPDALLIDGNRFRQYSILPTLSTPESIITSDYPEIPYTCIIKGDGKMMSIAAASILAKTHRDEYMCNIAAQYPQYQWSKNKGYPTKAHRAAISQYGTTPHHRMTFQLLDPQLSLF